MNTNSKVFFGLLAGIMFIGGLSRIYKITNPVADWHSFRQADTAAVARNFLKFGIDSTHPRYDDLSNIQSGKDNPMGWRMVEFPLYQVLSVFVYRLNPHMTIEVALRLVSILASVGSIGLIGWIGKKTGGAVAGIAAALLFAILPYSIFYGRVILPEPLMVFLSLLSITLMMLGNEKEEKARFLLQFLSVISASVALLVKPVAIFLLLPVGIVYLHSFKITFSFLLSTFSFLLITVTPLLLWRQWILQFPEGIPVYIWLLNEGNIRLKGAWFYWLFAERIGKLIFGYWGVTFLSLGVVAKMKEKNSLVPFFLLLGSLLYLIVIAKGNVQHDYYQILLLPVLALYAGRGIAVFLTPGSLMNRFVSAPAVIVILLFTLSFSWYEIRGFYWINRPEIIEAGITADQRIPQNAKVIAPYNGDTTFLYQTKRQGWPLGFDIPKKIAQGATHYVTVSPTDADGETKDLASRYTVLVRNDRFAIIDLTKPKITP